MNICFKGMLLPVYLIATLTMCANLAGTGTETSTKFAHAEGFIVDSSGRGVAGVEVILIEVGYNPVKDTLTLVRDTTDASGRYYLKTDFSGSFNILAIFHEDSSMAFVYKQSLRTNDTAEIIATELKKSGMLIYNPVPELLSAGGYVYIPGTIFHQELQKSTIFPTLPSGALPGLYLVSHDESSPVIIESELDIVSWDIARIFDALMVVQPSKEMNESDSLVLRYLERSGARVYVTWEDALFEPDGDFNLIVITSTVDPKVVDSFFTFTPVPIVLLEKDLYTSMAMTGEEYGVDFGHLDSETAINITMPSHPITGGLSGEVEIFNVPSIISWGVPAGGAEIIAYCSAQPDLPALFTYETDSQMAGIRAPARRVGIFMDYHRAVRNMNETGWQLFVNSVIWALGK